MRVHAADSPATYERLAPVYDHLHRLWLLGAGRGVERALLADLATTLRPGQQILDAGYGTGRVSRRIRALEPRVRLTMLDISAAMLARTEDIPATRTKASLLDLPFPDGSFDAVIATWSLETTGDPGAGLRECLRVLAPGGHLFCAVCALPDHTLLRALSAPTRAIVTRWFAGRFLDANSLLAGTRLAVRHRSRRQLALAVSGQSGEAPFLAGDDAELPPSAPAARHARPMDRAQGDHPPPHTTPVFSVVQRLIEPRRRGAVGSSTREPPASPASIEEAIACVTALGPAGEAIRLAGAEAERIRPRIETALRHALSEVAGPDGVRDRASTWIVAARVPTDAG